MIAATAIAHINIPLYPHLFEQVKKVGQVVRCICLLDHPLPNTKDALSTQIIIPQMKANRKSDIYVTMVSYTHQVRELGTIKNGFEGRRIILEAKNYDLFLYLQVASKGWFIGIVSTTVETDNPEKEIELGVQLLGPVKQKFIHISDVYEPLEVHCAEQIIPKLPL